MNNIVFFKELKPLKNLYGNPSNDLYIEPHKVIALNKLIKIQVKKLKYKTRMSSEEKSVLQLNNIRLEFTIFYYYLLKNLYLYFRLCREFWMVPYYFYCYMLFFLMVICFENLTEWTFAQKVLYFISICNLISSIYFGISIYICEISNRMNSTFTCI